MSRPLMTEPSLVPPEYWGEPKRKSLMVQKREREDREAEDEEFVRMCMEEEEELLNNMRQQADDDIEYNDWNIEGYY